MAKLCNFIKNYIISSTNIKKQLHNYIDLINDESALELLNEAAEAYAMKQPDILDILSDEQRERLKESQKQLTEGKGIPNEEAIKKSREWLKEHLK